MKFVKGAPALIRGPSGYVVAVGTDTGELHVVCPLTGEGIWKWGMDHPRPLKGISARPAQCIDGILSAAYDGCLRLFDFDGKIKWTIKLGDYLHSSPVVRWSSDLSSLREIAFIGTESDEGGGTGKICCIDARSGSIVWEHKTKGMVPCTPCLNLAGVLCGSNDGFIYSLHSETGALQWKTEVGKVKGALAWSGIAQQFIFATNEGDIGSIDATNGKILWKARVGYLFHIVPITRIGVKKRGCLIPTLGGVIQLDVETGETVSTYDYSLLNPIPKSPLPWYWYSLTPVEDGKYFMSFPRGESRATAMVIDPFLMTHAIVEDFPACNQPGIPHEGGMIVATNSEGLQKWVFE